MDSNHQIFVLDEADEISTKSGNKSQSKNIIKALPRTCQLLFFSATYADQVYRFCKAILSKQNANHKEQLNEIRVKSNEELVS